MAVREGTTGFDAVGFDAVGLGVAGLVAAAVGNDGTTTGAAELTTGNGDWVNALGTAVD